MKMIHVDTTASTNDLAWELLRTEQAPILVMADRQTAGRGRGTNDWSSPEGNIYLSLGLDVGTRQLQNISVRIAIHLCTTLNSLLSGGELRIKWPNDLMLGEGKAVGILVESRIRGDRAGLVAGIGLNIRQAPVPEAAALESLLKTDRDNVVSAVKEAILMAVENHESDLSNRLLRASWFKPGETVSYVAGNETCTAVFTGYDQDLAMCVDTREGRQSLNCSLVSRIRPHTDGTGESSHVL